MKTQVLMLGVLITSFSNVANAQDDNSGYGGRYQRRYRNNDRPQTESISESPKGYVAVSTGFSSATGSFGLGVGSGYGNYALSGDLESISAGIPINGSNFGVALMIAGHYNPFDIDSYVTNNVFPTEAGSWVDEDITGDYSAVNFMAGFFYTYPVKRFSFDVRAMIGYISLSTPEIQYDLFQPQPNGGLADDTWDIASSNARGVSYDIGAGIRYSFRRSMCFILNLDYLGASLPYNTVETHIDPNGSADYSSLTGTVPLSLFNISLGLGFQFGR